LRAENCTRRDYRRRRHDRAIEEEDDDEDDDDPPVPRGMPEYPAFSVSIPDLRPA